MTLFDPDDLAATGVLVTAAADDRVIELEPFRAAGVLAASDVHIARTIARLGQLDDPVVELAIALAARAPRDGQVAVDLATVAASLLVEFDDPDPLAAPVGVIEQLPWPEPSAWLAALADSPVVSVLASPTDLPADTTRPLVLSGSLLYLQRYWAYERVVAERLIERSTGSTGSTGPSVDRSAIAASLLSGDGAEQQLAAVDAASNRRLTVLVGGPGTGKTTTVAALLATLLDGDQQLDVALAAPTGKAAARLGEAFRDAASRLPEHLADRFAAVEASTIHRLLGTRPGTRTSFRHHRDRPLPHDVVVVDEASMISLPLMARLLDALRGDARLVVVGDPGQLASVEVGSVLADLAASEGAVSGSVVELRHSRRFPPGSPLDRLARAIHAGDAAAAVDVLGDPTSPDAPAGALTWVASAADTSEAVERVRTLVMPAAGAMVEAAAAGDADSALEALDRSRVLCAHRYGAFGVERWNRRIEEWLADGGHDVRGWYAGRPVMATANDYLLDLFNGDVGVVVSTGGRPSVVFPAATGARFLAPSRLDALETVHAMTIHKSQGSEFDHVVVVLPTADSRLASRELLYTAVTRARRHVTVVGDVDVVTAAIGRNVVRASGLPGLLA